MGLDRSREAIHIEEQGALQVSWLDDGAVQVRHKQRGCARIAREDDLYLLRGILSDREQRERVESVLREAIGGRREVARGGAKKPGRAAVLRELMDRGSKA